MLEERGEQEAVHPEGGQQQEVEQPAHIAADDERGDDQQQNRTAGVAGHEEPVATNRSTRSPTNGPSTVKGSRIVAKATAMALAVGPARG
jgi:hypothetical protein